MEVEASFVPLINRGTRLSGNTANYYSLEFVEPELSKGSDGNVFVKFLADLGATERFTHSTLIFSNSNINEQELVSRANKDSFLAVLDKRNIYVKTKNGSKLQLDDVLCCENLPFNLLSLNQLLDSVLSI